MAQCVKEADHPAPVWSEWFEQVQHLLVGTPRTPGQMMDNDVLGVEIPDLYLIGIAV